MGAPESLMVTQNLDILVTKRFEKPSDKALKATDVKSLDMGTKGDSNECFGSTGVSLWCTREFCGQQDEQNIRDAMGRSHRPPILSSAKL
jgi:hypothetical protein